MTLAELNLEPETKEKLKELLQEADVFRSVGISNFNGADSYRCPSCFCSVSIMGNASAYSTLDEIEHDSDCAINRLYKDLYE